MLYDGYTRLSKNGQPFALKQFANPSVLILPPDKFQELLSKSDDEINLLKTLHMLLAMRWTGDLDLAEVPIHYDVRIRSRLESKSRH
jgi:hypothetical protein